MKAHVRREGDSIITVERDTDHGVLFETWVDLKDRPHRLGSPAQLMYDLATGIAIYEAWYVEGKLHRADGPAQVRRDRSTPLVLREEWFLDGKLHRIDGPAVTCRNAKSGKVTYRGWYVNDEKIWPSRARIRAGNRDMNAPRL